MITGIMKEIINDMSGDIKKQMEREARLDQLATQECDMEEMEKATINISIIHAAHRCGWDSKFPINNRIFENMKTMRKTQSLWPDGNMSKGMEACIMEELEIRRDCEFINYG